MKVYCKCNVSSVISRIIWTRRGYTRHNTAAGHKKNETKQKINGTLRRKSLRGDKQRGCKPRTIQLLANKEPSSY